jgi:hypothetical protein
VGTEISTPPVKSVLYFGHRNHRKFQNMPIVVTPEIGIPLPFDTTPEEIQDFREKAHALFETVQDLVLKGAQVEVTPEDKAKSHQIAAEGKLPPAKTLTPGTIINLEAILSEWDQEVLDVNRRLRNYVTNKLLMESVDEDPRQRMKALENLGKISSVGLFSEKLEVTVTHRSVDDIEKELARTLEMYMGDAVQVEPTELDTVKSIGDIDLDEELGDEKPEDEPRATPES